MDNSNSQKYNERIHSYPRSDDTINQELSGYSKQDHPQIVYPENYYYGASPENTNWVNQPSETYFIDVQDSQTDSDNKEHYNLSIIHPPQGDYVKTNGYLQRAYGLNVDQATAAEDAVYINKGYVADRSNNQSQNSNTDEIAELKQQELKQNGFDHDNGRESKRESGKSPEAFIENGDMEIFGFSDSSIRRGFIRKVYLILICQLLVTLGLVAFAILHEGTLDFIIRYNYSLLIAALVLIVTGIALVYCTKIRRRVPYNYIFLVVFTVAESFVLGIIACLFAPSEVLLAIAITAAVCLGLTLFAVQTKWDFTLLGGALVTCSIILIFFGITASLFRANGNGILITVYACAGALLFSMYLVYDTQLIIGGKHKYQISPEEYIFAALTLYSDVINIFLIILILISKAKN